MLVHKKSKKQIDVLNHAELCLSEPPYDIIHKDKYEVFSEDLLPKGFKCEEGHQACIVYVLMEVIPNGVMSYNTKCTWDELHTTVTNMVRQSEYVKSPETILGVGLSPDPLYRSGRSKIIDPRHGTPFECLPNWAVLFVSMIQRAEGWKPFAIGMELCDCCGKSGNTEVMLKKCSKCKMAKYCSKECQSNDWKHHKAKCHA